MAVVAQKKPNAKKIDSSGPPADPVCRDRAGKICRAKTADKNMNAIAKEKLSPALATLPSDDVRQIM